MTNKTADQTVAAWEARETDMAKIARLVADPHSDALAAKDREIEAVEDRPSDVDISFMCDCAAEAMRAKCEKIARAKAMQMKKAPEFEQATGDERDAHGSREQALAAEQISDSIAALKAKP